MTASRSRLTVLTPGSAPAVQRGPYLTSKEAQRYLGYGTLHAFTCAYPRLGIPTYRLGRSLRFLQEDLDAALSRVEVVEPQPRRQRA